MEETKCLKPSDSGSRIGDRASVQAATRVNAEQASKRTMCRPTRQPFRGRLTWRGEMSEEYAPPLHRGSGGGMSTRKAHATREAPMRDQDDQPVVCVKFRKLVMVGRGVSSGHLSSIPLFDRK